MTNNKTQKIEELENEFRNLKSETRKQNKLVESYKEKYAILEDYNNQLVKENDRFKNWVASMLFNVKCENWFENFKFGFESWRNNLFQTIDEKQNRLNDVHGFILMNFCDACHKKVDFKDSNCEKCKMQIILELIKGRKRVESIRIKKEN